jgi:hypothetical protein
MPLDTQDRAFSMDEITQRVMLVSLSISTFSGERTDRRVTEEVAEKHNADRADSGRFAKQIISKHALEPIRKVATEARAWHYDVTLPWTDAGQRLLSVEAYFEYARKLNAYRDCFHDEVERFLRAYPSLIEQARTRLGTLFDVEDYPPVAELRRKFEFEFHAAPLPDARNWFLRGLETEIEGMRSRAEDRVREAVREAVRNVWERVARLTERMHERLTAYEVDPETGKVVGGVFRDSLVENVRDLVNLLPSLNLTNDPQLDALAVELRELCRYDAAALRAEPAFRAEVAEKAGEVMRKAKGWLG